jgi:hypothetical protein
VHDNRRVRTSGIAAVALAAVVALTGCSSSEPEAPAATTAPVPKGFDVPAGVTITKAGTRVKVGSPASIVYELGDGTTSAVTVTVSSIQPGSIDDFAFFSLDEATKKSSPYYVKVNVKNEGPAGIGGTALPLFIRDSSRTNLPASDIVGTFKPCPNPTLPASFLPGAAADLCLVYLVPEGRTPKVVALQTGTTQDAITWQP